MESSDAKPSNEVLGINKRVEKAHLPESTWSERGKRGGSEEENVAEQDTCPH